MIFVFEDEETDLLSKLFVSAYSNCSFYYVKGNGNISNKVKKLLNESDETIMVFLDTIPDNKDTIDIYNDLKRLSRRNNFRVIVMPIVCAEYYFICSLTDSLFISNIGLDICINKDYWRDSELIEDSDRKFAKNFEKYCKLILLKCVKDCVRHSRKDNSLYGVYYSNNCLCDSNQSGCVSMELVTKAINFVSKYPVFPVEGYLGKSDLFHIEELWIIHRNLVDDFNTMVDKYKDCDETRSYYKIDYIK